MYYIFFPLFTPQNRLVGRNPITTGRNEGPALDGRLGFLGVRMDCLQHVVSFRWYTRLCVGAELTQLIKVRVAAIGPRNRADQASLQECCPFVHQTSLAAHVILIEIKTSVEV